MGSKRNFITTANIIWQTLLYGKRMWNKHLLILISKIVKISGNAKLIFLHDKTCGHR